MNEQQQAYQTIATVIHYLQKHAKQQPQLSNIAAHVNLSEYHLQRLFKQWAGISPKRFLQFLTKEHAKSILLQTDSLLEASLESGLSGPGRLHDLMISCEAMTPGEIKTRGAGLNIQFGFSPTPFGTALIAWTKRGICYLHFIDQTAHAKSLLEQLWPNAQFNKNLAGAEQLTHQIFSHQHNSAPLKLLLSGTNFQIKVWEAVLNIGHAQLTTYSTLAKLAGSPNAQRATGTALGANKIAYLIPCHRVIKSTGEPGVYHWGQQRKQAIHLWESATQFNA